MTIELGAVTDFLIVGGIIAAMLAVGFAAWAAERRRRKQLAAALAVAGFDAPLEPGEEQKNGAFEQLGPFRDLRTGARGVVWCARGMLNGFDVTLVEHRYTSGTGKNRTTHRHTVAAVTGPALWPALSLVDEHIFHKIADLFGAKDLRLEDEAFNKRWRVTADNADFAMLVLTPAVQAWTLQLERGIQIRVGRGGLCLAASQALAPAAALKLASRAAELAAMLPPELEAWGSA